MTVGLSFAVFLAIFFLIGVSSAVKSRGTRKDYYLANQGVPPILTGLSAVATNCSGFMFIGVIGFTYATGFDAIWLMVGWIGGDFLASLFVHRQLRKRTERVNQASFSAVLGRWQGEDFMLYRRAAAIITVVFLGTYAAAQLAAGGKALHSLFAWPVATGAVMVGGMVAIYCLAGGLRASIWTDAAQAVVMMTAMALLCVVGLVSFGGPVAAYEALAAIPDYFNAFPDTVFSPLPVGAALFVLGWLFAGISVIGQPHIMVRFMSMDSAAHMNAVRRWYYGFYIIFYLLATGVGFLARLYLPELGSLDPELALPTMAQQLLPPVLVGLILAGIFAATMSTADSLVLSCSAAVSHDLLPERLEKTWQIKVTTVAVTVMAVAIAVAGPANVFHLVVLAWSTLASAFAPPLILLSLHQRLSEAQMLAMSACGVFVALAWRSLGWHDALYEGLPGILAGLAMAYLWRWGAGVLARDDVTSANARAAADQRSR